MIPHSSAGGQPWGHPMRALNGGGPVRLDLAQMPGQYDPPSDTLQPPLPQSQPPPQARQPAVVDLTASGFDSQDREPPPKRPKLDVSSSSNTGDAGSTMNSAEMKSTPGSAGPRPSVSWRGRPMWSFQAVMSETPGSENRGDNATNSRPSSPPPFPAQPWSSAPPEPPQDTSSRARDTSSDKKVQTTPYRIETPSMAPVLKGEKFADFTPWTGNHPEDVLNEQTAKQGYYDRTQVSQNESNTARPALYAQLKHRTGLHMLSSVFSAALEKRQNQNTIHAPSTFKPPPRVTLTDNKREAWLRDLANPSVPLRKLSRTIPHGIRGKVLLEQCLGKWIPVARAVWLAKCVGANEIRAFKRKGTSGALAVGLEAKWVREWTTSVQQFVEGVFSSPKSADWKARMTYAVGLTARLFFENLLDHDHFLEWFLSSFESATLTTVPVWLLMLGIYWNNLMRYRRRGRRLAEILLEKLRQATDAKLEPLKPLVDRLSRFITKLIHEHTSSLVIPNSWDMYKDHVSSCLDLSNKIDLALFQSIAERNARVQKPRHSKQATQRTPHQRITRLLDSIHSAHDIALISSTLLDAIDNKAVLVSKLLEWLATPFRHGICRVYVGVRLLRKWKTSGVDVDDHILSFLAQANNKRRLELENVYHAISELVRSQTFSVGRYLQWLMAKGLTSPSSSEMRSVHDYPCDVGLIAHLPVSRLPEHVGNLRNTLLARAGLSADEETGIITNVKGLISQRLPAVFEKESVEGSTLYPVPADLSWSVKAEIGQWLRRGVAEHTREATNSTLRGLHSGDIAPAVSALTPEEFYNVRDILETFGDISMLADVLKCASSSDDSTVLASVADTINCHFDSLCVIGATTDLFRKLVDSYAGIKRYGMPNLDLIFSLIELGLRIPNELNTVSILRQDLSRMENKSIMAASSPVSDHIPDSFVDTDPLFREKLDQLLMSGNVMDEPTLDTLFSTLTKHLESGDDKTRLSANDTCRYLAQLRSFQPKHFDGLLARWVCGHMRSSDRSALLRILPALIGVGCVTIRSFLSLAKRLNHPTAIPNAAELPAELVELLVPQLKGGRYLDLVSYRFQLSQQEFLVKNSDEALEIVRDAATFLQARDPQALARHRDLEISNVTLLCELLVRNPETATQACTQKFLNQHPAAMGVLQQALDHLLGVGPQDGQSSMDTGGMHPKASLETPVISEVEQLASTTDDFSLPFCQLKLQILFHKDSAKEARNSIVDAMFKTVVADSHARKPHWVDLVALMTPDAVRQIRERAEKEFFAIPLVDESSDTLKAAQDPGSLKTAKLYLGIIEELAGSIPESGAPALATILVEKMDTLLHKIITMQSNSSNACEDGSGSAMGQARSSSERSLAFWFSALLRMVVIHRASFTQLPQALRVSAFHEQCRLLVSIFCIALSRLPGDVIRLFPGADYFPHQGPVEDSHPCPGILLQTHALDVAASLIDVLPDEVRHQCGRFLKEKCPPFASLQTDTRFIYLLGPILEAHPSSLLQSASAPSPAASASTPTQTSASNSATGASTQQPAASSALYTGAAEGINCITSRLRLQHRGRIVGPYPIRPWELLEDAAPYAGVNDTAVNLGYFDARRVRA